MLYLVTKEIYGFETIFDALEFPGGVGRSRDTIIDDPTLPEIPALLAVAWSEDRPLEPRFVAPFLQDPNEPGGIFLSILVDENFTSIADFVEYGYAFYELAPGGDLIRLAADGTPFVEDSVPDEPDEGNEVPDQSEPEVETITGSQQSDGDIQGTSNDDSISGLGGNDLIFGGTGNDSIDGGPGVDTAVYSGDQSSYVLTLSPTGTTLLDRREGGDGLDTLIDVELLNFGSEPQERPFDLSNVFGTTLLSSVELQSLTELYIAYFNRAPDAIGLNFWGTAFANGTSLEKIAALFVDQEETRSTYPAGQSNADFATAVYNNVLGRIPDQDGFEFWVGLLDDGVVSQDTFILEVLRGAKSNPPLDASLDFIRQQVADQQYLGNV